MTSDIPSGGKNGGTIDIQIASIALANDSDFETISEIFSCEIEEC